MRNSTRYSNPTIGRGIELQKRENEWLSTISFFERSKQEIKKEYQNKKEKRINRAFFFFFFPGYEVKSLSNQSDITS